MERHCNLIYWRQLDAVRNSIQMVGQAYFKHKELQGKSCNDIQEMLHEERGINWNDYPVSCKRGTACIKEYHEEDTMKVSDVTEMCIASKDDSVRRAKWILDMNMPILKNTEDVDNRYYVEKWIM